MNKIYLAGRIMLDKNLLVCVVIIGAIAFITVGLIIIPAYFQKPSIPFANGQDEVGVSFHVSDEISEWEEYKNFGFEMRYPKDIIELSEEGEEIILIHSILLEHPELCDFRGDGPPMREKLIDFEIGIRFINQNLKEAIHQREGDFMASDFFTYLLGGEREIYPSTDIFSTGSLRGYRHAAGIEGCGEYRYYFPISLNKTLFVRRSFITEFQPITPNQQEYLALPNIITPDEETKLFNNIISTLQILDSDSICQEPVSVLNIAGLTYHQARPKIISAGWQPFQTISSSSNKFLSLYETDEGKIFWDRGYNEIESCLPTGTGGCTFLFQDECSNLLRVVTAGIEDGQTHSRVTVFYDLLSR